MDLPRILVFASSTARIKAMPTKNKQNSEHDDSHSRRAHREEEERNRDCEKSFEYPFPAESRYLHLFAEDLYHGSTTQRLLE
jgi:hypothetical protein